MKKIKVGIVSPASNVLKVFPRRCEQGKKNLKELGIETVFAHNTIRYNNCYQKSVKERIKELNEMIQKDVNLIMASIGGYTSIQLLQNIDYRTIQEKDITFCGFSDITALLLAIYTKTNKEVLYGPVYTVNMCDDGGIDSYTKENFLKCIEGKSFSLEPSSYSILEFVDWKDLEKKEYIKKKEKKENDWKVIHSGTSQGKLIGGNLATLLLILGTEYLPINSFDDSILFLEDCNTNIEEFCSYLESLKIKGVFSKIKGILFGKFDSHEMNQEIEKFLKDYFKDCSIPIVCNMDFGHVFPILTLPIGREVKLFCNQEKIKIDLFEKK